MRLFDKANRKYISNRCVTAGLMLLSGGVAAAIAEAYVPATQPVVEEVRHTEAEPRNHTPEEKDNTTRIQTATASVADESDWSPSLEEFNLTHYFPDGSDTSVLSESYAYDAFQQLMREDSDWMSSIYAYSDRTPAEIASRLGLSVEQVMGGYNPNDSSHDKQDPSTWAIHSFKTIRVSATDGDGRAITPKSNVLDILSMANTYTYFHGVDNYELFLTYAQKLWELSHSYRVSISDVYYCSGCVGDHAEENERAELEAELEQEEQEWTEYEEEEDLSDDSQTASSIVTVGGTETADSATEAEKEAESEPESQSMVIQVGASSDETEPAAEETPIQEISSEERSDENDETEASGDFTSYATTKETIAAFPSAAETTTQAVSATGQETEATGSQTDTAALDTEVLTEETTASSSARIIYSGDSVSRDAQETENDHDVTDEAETEYDRDRNDQSDEDRTDRNPEEETTSRTGTTGTDLTRTRTNTATQSNASYCPGHVDLIVYLKITGLDEETNNLFSLDAAGNDPAGIGSEEGQWPGWTDEMKAATKSLATQDWYQKYGLSVSILSPGNPLTETEIASYMALLPDDISETRRELVRFALYSIGKVPYYWGGKPSHPGYEGNHFGIPVSPDVDGRILKGLDCSGWISWVYWSVTGERLPYESTAGLAFAGKKISREELRPGDIIIRTGSNAHVIMFLGWETNGNVLCINETSGSDNNVVISSREANWPYYRCLVD